MTPSSKESIGQILAKAAPFLAVVLLLLSLCTLWFADLLHSAPLLDDGGVVTWQGKVELILAYSNIGWVGLLLLLCWRGWVMPTLLCLTGFVVNYAAWVVMAIETPL